MTGSSLCVVVVSFFGFSLFNRVGGRQMCLSCQYVSNPDRQGLECASDPWKWAWGNNRMRCPHRCFIDAQFDKETGEPVFIYRGCTEEERQEEGCHTGEAKEYCWWGCEGDDYCNNTTLTIAPSKQALNVGSTEHHYQRQHRHLYSLLLCVVACFVWYRILM